MEDKLLEILIFLLRERKSDYERELSVHIDRLRKRDLTNLSQTCESYIAWLEEVMEDESE